MQRKSSWFMFACLIFAVPAVLFARGGGGGGGRGGFGGGGGGGFGGGHSYGGGGFSGGGGFDRGGFSGGDRGFSGGGNFNAGGFDRGNVGGGNFGGAGRDNFGGGLSAPNFGGAGRDNFGGGADRIGGFNNAGGDRFGAGGLGAQADRFNAPDRGQLNNFLGLPSDEGAHNPGGNFDVNKGTATGPRGGEAAGATVTGPRGNTTGKAWGVGADGGVGTIGGVKGADGGVAARGAAVGPNGRAVAGEGVRGADGYGAARGVAAGPNGVAAGFTRTTPAGRYTAAAGVRTNFNHWGVYGRGWYADHPGAWFATGWAAGAMWNACTWDTCAAYYGYSAAPIYYDYGTNVTYQDNGVYVDGTNVGTPTQYYDQAAQLATTGAQAQAPADGDWLPLGVFALTKTGASSSDVTIQLAVNKEGILRGNYTDTVTNATQLVQGSVDKQTQRVAFTVGTNTTNVVETGLYNLTKDEAPALIHFGKEKTEQWLLVRLKKPDGTPN